MKQQSFNQYLHNSYTWLFCLILIFIAFLILSNPAQQKAASSNHKERVNVSKKTIQQAQTDPGPSIVSVNGRQLIVQRRNPNGTLEPAVPYTIRGVNWSPASQNTNTSTTDPNNANVRRPEFGIWAATDIPLMRNMNVNTVRMFIDPGFDANGRAVLDQLYSNGIMVIMTVDDAVNNMARVQQAVNFYKDHPAILMWMLGSEWNINRYFTNPPISVAEAAQRTQQAAALIKTLDTIHPVATSYGEIDINGGLSVTQGFVNQTCPSVDIWALNIYRGNTFGTLFEQWRAISSKPMLIGEFGTDSFRSYDQNHPPDGTDDETLQSQWVLSEWNHIFKNLSAVNPSNAAIGGFVFEWNDEWWKVQPWGAQQKDGCNAFDGCAGHPDQFGNEEYFGIVDINRQPRLMYQTLTTAFAPNYQPPSSITYRALSRGYTAQEYPFQNGVCRFFKDGRIIHQVTGGAGGGRGFNVAVMDACTGELKYPIQNFDTWSDSTRMIAMTNFLNSLSNGDLVLIAVADEAGLKNPSCVSFEFPWQEAFYQALGSLGSARIRQYCFRDSWALSAIKGNPGTAQEQLMVATEANASFALPIQTTISPSNYFFTQNAGSSNVTVTSPSNCSWTAVSNNTDWLNILSGNSGSGNGIVNFSATAFSGYLRAGTMTIAGQPFVVTQGCRFTVNPTSQNFPAGGGSNGNFTVSTDANCAWTATSDVNWITFPNGNTGSGNGTVNYSVAANSGTNQRTGTINVNGQVHTVTQSGAPTNVQVTVQTNPLGRSFSVDGTTYTSAQTFNWTSGSSHSIGTFSPQSGGSGTQYLWSNWSDGQAMTHNVAPTVNTIYTANFTTQYFLTMSANPENGGTVSPSSGWYNAGLSFQISAAANNGYTFSSWTGSGNGSYSGINNTATVTMNAPISETANFNSMPSCLYSISSQSANFSAGSGNGSFNVIAPNGCAWTATLTSSLLAEILGKYEPNFPLFKLDSSLSSPSATFPANPGTLGAIPDAPASQCGAPGTSKDITFSVSGLSGNVTNVEVNTAFGNPAHTWTGDITAVLIAPNGASHSLFGRTGTTTATSCGDSSDLAGNYMFKDSATSPPSGGWWQEATTRIETEALTSGSYRTTNSGGAGATNPMPNTNMNASFTGVSNPNGTWILRLADFGGGDTGSISAASLTVETATPPSNWLTITSGSSGNGNGTVNYSVTQNTGQFRTGQIIINANGQPQATHTVHQFGSTAPGRKPFDFDGDGKTDISIFRPSVGEWWYLKSSTGGNSALQFGSSTDKLTPGDFTGDGKTDIAFFRPNTGFWFILRSEDFSFFSFPFGTNGDIPAPADYDGDGKVDAAVFRPSTATWFVLKSGGGTTITQFGTNGDKPVIADYDGDGKADIAIFRPSVGEWWYQKSSTGQTAALQFGSSSDRPVPGDYTGDGKADIAFFRPSTGFWFILRSEDFSFFSFPFGASGDIPAPGDYDGDGKFDTAVFRPSTSTWFVNRTTAGILITNFGATGDIPVPSAFVP